MVIKHRKISAKFCKIPQNSAKFPQNFKIWPTTKFPPLPYSTHPPGDHLIACVLWQLLYAFVLAERTFSLLGHGATGTCNWRDGEVWREGREREMTGGGRQWQIFLSADVVSWFFTGESHQVDAYAKENLIFCQV